jgi:hypothetical protein
MVPKEVVSRYLLLQIKECLFDVLTFKEGRYKFEAFSVRPVPWGGEPIRPDVLMMEGMQFLDEYPIYRQKFPAGEFERGGYQHDVADAGHHGDCFDIQPLPISNHAQYRVFDTVGPMYIQPSLAYLLLQRADLVFGRLCFTNDDHVLS